jgi:hypothetical protein
MRGYKEPAATIQGNSLHLYLTGMSRSQGGETHRVASASTPPVSHPRPAPIAPAPAIAAKVMFLGLPCGKLVPTIPAAAGEATAKPAPASARANPSPMIFWWGQTCYSKGAVLTGMKPLMAIQTVQNVIPSRYAERRP